MMIVVCCVDRPAGRAKSSNTLQLPLLYNNKQQNKTKVFDEYLNK